METPYMFSPRSPAGAAFQGRSNSKISVETKTKFFFNKRAMSTIRNDD